MRARREGQGKDGRRNLASRSSLRRVLQMAVSCLFLKIFFESHPVGLLKSLPILARLILIDRAREVLKSELVALCTIFPELRERTSTERSA